MAANPFDVKSDKTYVMFPNDEYIDACILSFQCADAAPGPLAQTNDPVPSVRFLLGGLIKDDSGQIVVDQTGAPICVRKWTNWLRISYSSRSALMQLFVDFAKKGDPKIPETAPLPDILKDYETADGKLWQTPLKIMLEQGEKYQHIMRIKPGTNYDLCKTLFYDEKYVPYKVQRIYGRPTALTSAGCKNPNGISLYDQSNMADEPADDKK